MNKRDEAGFNRSISFFVVSSALGQSPAKICVTIWNLERFPTGSPHDVLPAWSPPPSDLSVAF
jgi:hypothetical protein